MNPPDLDGRVFVPVQNAAAGTVTDQTRFEFSQNGTNFTARYHGGPITDGHILGQFHGPVKAELLYHCVTKEGELKAGQASATFSALTDGRVCIDMCWRWLNGEGEGMSRYEEIP